MFAKEEILITFTTIKGYSPTGHFFLNNLLKPLKKKAIIDYHKGYKIINISFIFIKQMYVKYCTDNGDEVTIRIDYLANKEERLSRGNMEELQGRCGRVLGREDIYPRYVQTKDIGIVNFKKHQDYIDYVYNPSNVDNIIEARGEVIACSGLHLSMPPK